MAFQVHNYHAKSYKKVQQEAKKFELNVPLLAISGDSLERIYLVFFNCINFILMFYLKCWIGTKRHVIFHLEALATLVFDKYLLDPDPQTDSLSEATTPN